MVIKRRLSLAYRICHAKERPFQPHVFFLHSKGKFKRLSQFVMIVLLLVALCGGALGVDLTVTERATGSAVVSAVVDIITQSCVFDNDRLLLRRIAYAETGDGTSRSTFDRGGGIWQVGVCVLFRQSR